MKTLGPPEPALSPEDKIMFLKGHTRKVEAKPKPKPNGTGPEHAAESEELAVKMRRWLSVETWAKRAIPEIDRLLGDLVTTTTRMFLVGRAGLGKTQLGHAIGNGIASAKGFLHWQSSRPARVLMIDGEMPAELIKVRSIDVLRRGGKPPPDNLLIFSRDLEEQFAAEFPSLGVMPPLNTEEGHNYILALIDFLGGVDVVIFDNVMSLITGDHKDELPWSDTLPLVMQLTRRRVGQIWIDHTGHNTDRQYGSATKAWRFDAVGLMTPLPHDQRSLHELAFTLSFEHPGKARRRTPDNWRDFETVIIRLKEDQWTSEPHGNDNRGTTGPSRRLPPLSDDAASLWQHVLEVATRSASTEQPEPGIPPVPTIRRSELIAQLIQGAWFAPETIRMKDAAIALPPQSELKRLNNRLDTLKRREFVGFNRHCIWLTKLERPA